MPEGRDGGVQGVPQRRPVAGGSGEPLCPSGGRGHDKVFGKETVYIRSGGSIPIVGLFDMHLKIPSVMMGFGLPDDNLHAPNEKLYLPNLYRRDRSGSEVYGVAGPVGRNGRGPASVFAVCRTFGLSATPWARCACPPTLSTARRRSARSRISRSAGCAFRAAFLAGAGADQERARRG